MVSIGDIPQVILRHIAYIFSKNSRKVKSDRLLPDEIAVKKESDGITCKKARGKTKKSH